MDLIPARALDKPPFVTISKKAQHIYLEFCLDEIASSLRSSQ